MSRYLTFEEYYAMGGRAEYPAFCLAARLAEKKLDSWTQGRIAAADEDVRLCMRILVDALAEQYSGEAEVASCSNDGLSIHYRTPRTEEERMASLYRQVAEILPERLVRLVME